MKRNMKKLAVLLGMISLLGLAGCGNQASEGDVVSETQETEAVEITETQAEETKAEEITETTTDKQETTTDTQATEQSQPAEGMLTGLHHIEIVIKDYGTIALELDADHAPISTTNFVNLAQSGFYDGLTFHRIIEGFMIQGGDPLGNGMGGADQTIKGEFAANGVDNPIAHERGVISMARSQMMDSASSQFFIMHQDAPYLDGQYAAFGHVTSGIEIVDQICANTPVEDGNGTVLPENQPKIEKITVID